MRLQDEQHVDPDQCAGEREPERVLADVLDGLVSPAEAARAYGVALTADGAAVDAVRTEALRR